MNCFAVLLVPLFSTASLLFNFLFSIFIFCSLHFHSCFLHKWQWINNEFLMKNINWQENLSTGCCWFKRSWMFPSVAAFGSFQFQFSYICFLYFLSNCYLTNRKNQQTNDKKQPTICYSIVFCYYFCLVFPCLWEMAVFILSIDIYLLYFSKFDFSIKSR